MNSIFLSHSVSTGNKSINFLIKLKPKGKFNQEMKFKVNPLDVMYIIVNSVMWIAISKMRV
jgi:hypothetical protein